MPISLAILLITLIGGGIFLMSNQKKDTTVASDVVKSSEIREEEIEEETVSSLSPEFLKTSTPSPTITEKNLSEQSDFIYPNSTKTSGGGDSFIIESSDDPTTITDWYKEKIRGMGLNVKTFVTTKTNGKVLNKLVGAGGAKEIKIEISKEADRSVVRISVDIS